jgi:hypothetical protein
VDEEKLSNLDELPEDEFRPAFLEEVHRFIKCALHSSPPKVVNQVEITGHRKSDYYLKRLPRESETECMEAFILPDTFTHNLFILMSAYLFAGFWFIATNI